jgi:LAGLIDADG-like domain
MDEQELVAYIAGLFDAEGSIIIEKKKPAWTNKTIRYVLTVTLTNTRRELVQIAQDRYGGWIIGPVYQKETQKPFYRWRLEGSSARAFLRDIESYLIIKHDRVALAYELQDRIENYHHKPLGLEEVSAREEIYQCFRSLNRRGAL